MGQRRFDEASLVKQLSRLPADSSLAFALCCATRQLAACNKYAEHFVTESLDFVRVINEQLWATVTGNASAKIDWRAMLEQVMEFLPEQQDHWEPFHVYADHAISSLAYSIRCLLNADAQEAAWSARRAYEAADQAAIRDLDARVGLSGTEARILAHPIVQRELQRQERDLQLLESAMSKQVLNSLRAFSLSEPMLSLKEMSK